MAPGRRRGRHAVTELLPLVTVRTQPGTNRYSSSGPANQEAAEPNSFRDLVFLTRGLCLDPMSLLHGL